MALVSVQDVKRLVNDPSADSRASMAEKLGQSFEAGNFSASELDYALQIFRLLAKDAVERVRAALALALKASPAVPHDLAVTLARDVDLVSLPFLSESPALKAADLVDIIESQRNLKKMQAIAARARVEGAVVDALIDYGDDLVVSTVVANPEASFDERLFGKVVDRFGAMPIVQESLVGREDLPPAIAERLIVSVSGHLKDKLLAKTSLTPAEADALVLASRERATLSLARGFSEAGISALVAQLKQNERLTSTIALRAACMGNLRFLEHAIASLAGVQVQQTASRLRTREGFDALWDKANLAIELQPAAWTAYEAVREFEIRHPGTSRGIHAESADFNKLMVSRLSRIIPPSGGRPESDSLEHILTTLSKLHLAAKLH